MISNKKVKEEEHPFYSDKALSRWNKKKKELELEEKLLKRPSKKEEEKC